jgi:hypothetical protein
MKMLWVIPLLDKEGVGVVDWFGLSRTHHPLTPSSAEEGSHFHGSELGRRCGFSSGAGSCRAAVALIFSPDFSPRVRGSFTGCGKTLPSWHSVRSFGVRDTGMITKAL